MRGDALHRARSGRRVAVCLALLLAAAAGGAPGASADAPDSRAALDHWAREYMISKVSARLSQAVDASCRRKGRRGRRVSWSCTWRGTKPLAGDHTRVCAGRSRVSYAPPRRWRSRQIRRRCVVQTNAPAVPRHFGFSDNAWLDTAYGVDAPGEADLVARAGANAHRIFFDWRYAERERDRFVEANFAHYTRMYDALLARGIKPLITIAFAPPWAWEPLTNCYGEQCRYPPGRWANDEWAEIVAELARRYPQSAGIEIWNEPNIGIFWRNPNPRRYVELLSIAYDTIKRVDPDMVVVGGALGNVPPSPPPGDMPTVTFLDGAYRAGMASKMDALSMHSYPFGPDLGPGSIFRRPFDEVRRLIEQHGDRGRRIWVTEVGVSTSDSRPGQQFTEEQQASILTSIQRELAATPDVDALFIHSLLDRPRYPAWNQEFGYGVMRVGRPPSGKSAYCRLVRAAGNSYSGC